MSGILDSFLSKPVVQKALRLPQQSNRQPAADDEPHNTHPKPHDIEHSANYKCSDDSEDPTMSGSNQEKHTAGHSGSKGFTETETETLVASLSPPIDSSATLPQSNGICPEQDRSHVRHTSPRDVESTSSTSIQNNPATSIESHFVPNTTQYGSDISSDGPQEDQESSNRNPELDEMGGQFLLPEDDGMGALRKRIHAIRDLGYTNTEQARMIHDLMTEKYTSFQAFSGSHLSPISSPTPSFRTPERADTPNRWSGQSFDHPSVSSASTAISALQDVIHNLTAEDLKPTFHPKVETEVPADDLEDPDAEEVDGPCLGCPHYKRNVKLQCFDCRKWYTCRFCHDEIEDHRLDRPKTENMLCMLCGHAQPAAQYCKWCGELAAEYYCVACRLWDNDASKSIYHCNDCGICRIGKGIGKDFFHCKTCSVCLPVSIEKTHRCIERSTQCDCPICGDYMFTSPETVVFMRCGHSIHQRCLSEYSKSSYRCPICSKTITNMEATFRNLDRTIQSQPMPADFKDTKAIITCNDCGTKSVVKYHWLGLKCDMCESYNTTQLSVLQGDEGHLEQDVEGGGFPASRFRSSSHGADDSTLPPLAPLQIDPCSAPGTGPHPQFNSSRSANRSERFHSYNLTRGRAVSPVISNYFGIPPDRQSQSSTSTSFFGSRFNPSEENDGEGELSIWGTRFKYRYGFLSRVTDPADDGEEGEEGEEPSDSSSESDDKEDEEDEEEEEGIDIFGHR